MLSLQVPGSPPFVVEPRHHDDISVHGALWIDLLNPTEAEMGLVERALGRRVPGRDEIAEIEQSSRLQREGDALILSTPMARQAGTAASAVSPLGFVVSSTHLVTIRYAEFQAFEAFSKRLAEPGIDASTGAAAFLRLLEAIVERLADVLEIVGHKLDVVSRRIFHGETHRRRRREDLMLRATIREIGRCADTVSNVRDSLLGMGRILNYARDVAGAWIEPAPHVAIGVLRHDLTALSEYDGQLSNKAQFLLDATFGLIGVAQNNGIRILTVVSIVGIPPTLVASIYGMNFEKMPELHWTYGYPYGLALIALSALVPLAIFRRLGWF